MVTQVSPSQYGREINKGTNTRNKEKNIIPRETVFIATHCPEVIHAQNYGEKIIVLSGGLRSKGNSKNYGGTSVLTDLKVVTITGDPPLSLWSMSARIERR